MGREAIWYGTKKNASEQNHLGETTKQWWACIKSPVAPNATRLTLSRRICEPAEVWHGTGGFVLSAEMYQLAWAHDLSFLYLRGSLSAWGYCYSLL
jgi:hypothetical protein